jgi:ketosteroid isomerase-like protein
MENEILEETAALVSALECGDVVGAGDVYADGARLLASSAELIQGRAEIEAYWRAGIELGLSGLEFESRVLEELGGSVLELGRYVVSVRNESAMPLVEHGTYLVLHTQSVDGSWRRAVEVYHPDEPTSVRHTPARETR